MERELFWTSMAYVQASGPFCHCMAFAKPPNLPELQFLHCKIEVVLPIKLPRVLFYSPAELLLRAQKVMNVEVTRKL